MVAHWVEDSMPPAPLPVPGIEWPIGWHIQRHGDPRASIYAHTALGKLSAGTRGRTSFDDGRLGFEVGALLHEQARRRQEAAKLQ